ncbi:MAG: TolC family protein [candidate division Zixibacteria bacterium]|nr:TolC family protein [candidate division Zixibacteria bacterium]
MIVKLRIIILRIFLLGFTLFVICVSESIAQVVQWKNPFENTSNATSVSKDSLTLSEALSLVSRANPGLQAGRARIKATEGLITQAGLRPNPKFEIVAEEFGGSASGFRESEFNITLSQEFELWGKRGNRKKLANSVADLIKLDVSFANFDIYASVVERFFDVAHAQKRVGLSQEASEIAKSVAETAKTRVKKGAALKSEFLLGELELGRAQLNLAEAESNLISAKERLSSLWQDSRSDFSVKAPSANVESLADLDKYLVLIENSREVTALNREENTIKARLNLAQSNGKPSVTITGGMKRLEVDNANTFRIGAGLPLPFFNRNQGSTASLRASIKALEFERQRAIADAETEFKSIQRRLTQLVSRYSSLRTSLLPKAEETYRSLKSVYDSGRMSYSFLLESQRTLVELRFEVNDIDLAIRKEIVSLERLLGVTIN